MFVPQAPLGPMIVAGVTTRSQSDIRLGLLGSFNLRIDQGLVGLPMNAQRLVSFLALHDGLLLRTHVAGSLWGDTTERHAAGSLRSALWRLGIPTSRWSK